MKKISSFMIAVLVLTASYGQLGFTNSGNLQIHTGATASGFGNFSNTSTAVLINNGNFHVKGNLNNEQPSMTAGTGTLYLNGTSNQAIGGSHTLKLFNLNTGNSAGILLNNNLSVSGLHTFSSGLISSSATPNYLIYEAGASYAGSNDTRHMTGWVKKIGTTNFSFPVGDGSVLRPVALQNLSGSAEFDCRYYRSTPNLTRLTVPVRMVRSSEYWQINKINGGTAQVTLNWDHSKVAMDNVLLADILTGYYTGTSWTERGGVATGNVNTAGSITSSATSSFGPFALVYKTYPVPLTLISFTAERKQGITYLKWITDNEQQVSHFEVERSYDGVRYTVIGNVAARNSGITQNYGFEDPAALSGYAWYRIRCVDKDGQFKYTHVAMVSENNAGGAGFLVTNPVRTAMTVFNKNNRSGQFRYRLLNSTGQIIVQGSVTMDRNGGAVINLPSHIAAGIYVLDIGDDWVRYQTKLLIEK